MSEIGKLRKLIVSNFALNGFTIQEKGCVFLAQQLEPFESRNKIKDRDEWLEKVLDYVTNYCTNEGNIVTHELLIKAVNTCCVSESLNDDDILHVTHAYKMPRYRYCSTTKKFLLIPSDTKVLSMFGDAKSKIKQYIDRYLVIRQRMNRIKTVINSTLDQPLSIGDKIRDVDYLLSSGAGGKFDHRSKKSPTLLLGILVQLKEGGRHYLEDPTGAIPLDLSTTEFQKGFFSENCCVLAEGYFCSDREVFTVTNMALPPCERAEISKIYFGESFISGSDEDYYARSNNPRLLEFEKNRRSTILFVCDVFLDDPKVLRKFHILLSAFNDMAPVAIVLMGDYLSCCVPSHEYAKELKFHMTQLGHYLRETTPKLCKNTTVVFLPGPGDRYCGAAGASILPRPSIPECLTEEFHRLVRRSIFTSNPCHLQYCTQQIHIVRADGLMKKTANYDVRQKSLDQKKCNTFKTETDDFAIKNYIKTLESQSHLITVPLEICPTYWPLASHSLSLYPMPDLVCVADANAPEYSTKNSGHSDCIDSEISSSSGCVFFNPSSFAKNKYRFSVYVTVQHKIEDSQIPDNDEDSTLDG